MKALVCTTALKWLPKSRTEQFKLWPEYFLKMRGLETGEWTLYVGIEHECEEDRKFFLDIATHIDVIFVPNEGPRGIDYNSITAWQRAIDDGAEFVAFLESDVYPGPDFLDYMSEMSRRFRDDPTVFCVNSYTGNEDVARCGAVYRKPSMGIWGMGMWRDRSEQCLLDFHKSGTPAVVAQGWDVHLNKVSRRGRDAIQPCLSRVLNVGMDGVHFTGRYVPELNAENRTWSADLEDDLRPEDFYEIEPLPKSEYVKVKEWK